MSTPHRLASALIVAATGSLLVIATPASASPGSAPSVASPLVDGLAGPLQFAVGERGSVVVAQAFGGALSKVDRRGNITDLVTLQGGGIDGVALGDDGEIAYTSSLGDENGVTATSLTIVRKGKPDRVIDLLAYETTVNPDQINQYGAESISAECAAQLPADGGPPVYQGVVDSHPYSVTSDGEHGWYVGEAAGNDVLHVSARGEISTVAVLPPQPLVLTAEFAATYGVPDCVVGLTYDTEPVPTDVEVGPDGMLYVSTLPGFDDPMFGPRGSVYRIDPEDGTMTRLATGFAGATNVAVNDKGTVFVAELFGGQVSKIERGVVSTVVSLNEPAAVEWSEDTLWVSYDAFGSGKIAKVNLGKR